MGLGRGFGFVLALCSDSGSQTALQVDTAYAFESAGEAVFCRFDARESQTSGTLTFYAYCSAVTGSPTFKAEIRNGPPGTDPDRPESGGSALATSGDVTPSASSWATFTLTGVSLTAGNNYFINLYNSHATPASNYASWVYRGACDYHDLGNTRIPGIWGSGYTSDGFSTDPVASSAYAAPMVLKYNSGTVVGFPYVASEGHANDTNDRGNRLNFSGALKAFGHSGSSAVTQLNSFDIYQNTTTIASSTASYYAQQRHCTGLYGDVILNASTDYDFVLTFSTSSNSQIIYTMGQAEGSVPADVLAARPNGAGGYVDGATPGSYTLDTSKLMNMMIYLSDTYDPVGGGGGLLIHPGMGGGLRG